MNPGPIASALSPPLTITLAHFLWEGVLIGMLTALMALGFRGRAPQSRYAVYLMGMLLMVACLPITFSVVCKTSSPSPESNPQTTSHSEIARSESHTSEFADPAIVSPPVLDSTQRSGLSTVAESSTQEVSRDANEKDAEESDTIPSGPNWLERLSPYVAAAYWLGLTVMLLRIAVSIYGGHRLRHDAVALSGQELEIVHRAANRIGLRRVPLVATCRRASGPIVIGMLRPVVLLPAMLVSGLSAQQIETVLTHEFTHLRRYDHWVLMFQRLAEALLFFHPAVWFVSRGLSDERENCCDDAVIATGTPRLDYAELLVKIAEQRTICRPTATALAATGGKPSRLRLRVLRLLDPPVRPILRLGRPQAFAFLGLMAACVLMPVLAYVLAQSPAANESSAEATDVEQSRPKENEEVMWSDPLKGLRVRLSAPNGNQYRRGEELPLLVELQNITEQPIAFTDLHSTYDIKIATDNGDWLGIARSHVAISPWEGMRGELAPRQILKWHIWFDRLRLNKPATAGSSVDVRVSVPQQIEEPGKLPRTSYSAPVRLKLIDALPTSREADDSPPQLEAGDVSDRWMETMDLVYREMGGLKGQSRAIHIDGQGRVTMLNCGSPGRKETQLDQNRLDALASRLKQIQIWNLSKISWQDARANPDEPEIRVSLAYGGASISGDYANRLVRSNGTLMAFQAKILAVIDEALKAKSIEKMPGEATAQRPPIWLAQISRRDGKDPAIVWGDPVGGLAVGIGEISTSLKSPVRPILQAYLENRGPNAVEGISLSRACFILELDEQIYAEADFGGPVGVLPPGKRVGPISIPTDYFNKVKDLKSADLVDQTTPRPNLTAGEHTLRLHYTLHDGANGSRVASEAIKCNVELTTYPVEHAVALIVKELNSADPDIRRDAALAAGKLSLAGCRDSLEKVLNDKDKVIRRYAAESLGKIGDPAAIPSLRRLLKDNEMEVRLASADSLVQLGVSLDPAWVEPVIQSKDPVFQNAIWLVRRHAGKEAVPTLIRCLDVNDASVNNYYNYTLVWQIHASGGPDLKYHHDFDNKGTPEEVEENRQVLARLVGSLNKPKVVPPKEADAQSTPANASSKALTSYLNSTKANAEEETRALDVIEKAQLIRLHFERDTPTTSVEKDSVFARSLKGSDVTLITQSRSSKTPDPGPPSLPDLKDAKIYPAIQLVFSRLFGAAQEMTAEEWLLEMKRPLAESYQLTSIDVILSPSQRVKKASFEKAQSAMNRAADRLSAIKEDFAQLKTFEARHLDQGQWQEAAWPRFAHVSYEQDVGPEQKGGREKLSNVWCDLHFSFVPISGNPRQRPTPTREYPRQGLLAIWSIETANESLKKEFQTIVMESLKELDALETELDREIDSTKLER